MLATSQPIKKQLLQKQLIFVMLLSVVTTALADTRYCNERFGFCVSYPAQFKKEAGPDNGDGQAFYDAQGFSLIVSGMNNVMDYDLNGLLKSQRKDFDKITYQAQGKNWFVLSGYKNQTILYMKFYLNPQTINHLHLQYPKTLSRHYRDTVTRIVKSFTPGQL